MIKNIDAIIDSLSIEELVGQTMCISFSPKTDPKKVEALINEMKPGAVFVQFINKEFVKDTIDKVNKVTKVPVIISADVENGPGYVINEIEESPFQMALGACNDEKLIEEFGYYVGRVCRNLGINYTFSPVVDLCLQKDNTATNIRCISDNADRVINVSNAFIKGIQTDNNMVATCKHFPGDGVDERNQHFCTTINSLSKEEWDSSYGKIFKNCVDTEVPSIMIGHIALPCYEEEKDEYGYMPATASKSLIQGLLKDKLGYKGCVMSDAMCMIGIGSRVPNEERILRFFEAGGDFFLIPTIEEYRILLNAVKTGRISLERIKDAVRRVLLLKEKAGLFNTDKKVNYNLDEDLSKLAEITEKITEKSVKVVRDYKGVLNNKIKKGSKILIAELKPHPRDGLVRDKLFDPFKEALKERGCEVKTLITPDNHDLEKIMFDYDYVLVNYFCSPHEFYSGHSFRIDWDNIMTFWHGTIFEHKNVIFTSFGDPYKLFELPFLSTYINAFSCDSYTQRAVVKLLFGEIECTAKNPVTLDGFFEYEE